MADRLIDDKTSDTLVAGLRLMVLDEEFDSPPSPPEDELNAPSSADGAFSYVWPWTMVAPVPIAVQEGPCDGNRKRHQGRSVAAEDAARHVRIPDVAGRQLGSTRDHLSGRRHAAQVSEARHRRPARDAQGARRLDGSGRSR